MTDDVQQPAASGFTTVAPPSGGPLAAWIAPTAESRVDQVAVAEIHDRPWLREDAAPDDLHALRSSVALRGIIEPLLLRRHGAGGFEVVTGQRRLEVARALQLVRLPAIVRTLSEREALLVAAWTTVERRRGRAGHDVVGLLHAAGVTLDELRALTAPPGTEAVTFPRTAMFMLLPEPLGAPRSGRSLGRLAPPAAHALPPLPEPMLLAALRSLRSLTPAPVAA